MDKNKIRQNYREKRKALPLPELQKWNAAITETLVEFFGQKYGSHAKPMVAAFRAKQREADAWEAFVSLAEKDFRFCFPRVLENTERSMEFREVDCSLAATEFEKGSFGLLEPKKSCSLISVEDMDCILVPVLVFDEGGGRMGHGKGFYDQMLVDFKRPKIGIAYEWQCFPEALPMDGHDVFLDYVITEKGVRKLTRS